ncbi:isochorismatase family protein [Paenibacillus albiflavus]|uniref:Isochorismatase family protein n=1 Tax=Paenibacillus albiflavus TaxID=2545760 RepID=A0A4R4EIR2_9BACL|nr:isochorismatase family protein [Paenibacillus albiflavus]TCZ80046.1 isochorismatase family protein [Paenibacillus albiflavus]
MMKQDIALVVVDVQGKLARMVHESEQTIAKITAMIKGMQVLGAPIIWLEQYPQGLGPSIEEVSSLLEGKQAIPKVTFDACGTKEFMLQLKESGCKRIALVGIETHICVYQTAVSLMKHGYEVQVVTDAVSSRTVENKQLGLQRMQSEGVKLTGVEMLLYELVQSAKSEHFKPILNIIK